MKTKRGICAIIFSNDLFLILKRMGTWHGWEFVKGAIENGETDEEALKREVKEETGLDVKEFFRVEYQTIFNNKGTNISNEVFLVRLDSTPKINLEALEHPEHNDYKWASSEEVLSTLTWDEDRKAFQKALQLVQKLK
ncbi:NUDIX hydrolase [Candidatus Woesearchaeota archaeon]|nr:MAG: NUDIX hydrolase [Candidatus Woesearchaeota archaeon]